MTERHAPVYSGAKIATTDSACSDTCDDSIGGQG
jgi:hypothetical protein